MATDTTKVILEKGAVELVVNKAKEGAEKTSVYFSTDSTEPPNTDCLWIKILTTDNATYYVYLYVYINSTHGWQKIYNTTLSL